MKETKSERTKNHHISIYPSLSLEVVYLKKIRISVNLCYYVSSIVSLSVSWKTLKIVQFFLKNSSVFFVMQLFIIKTTYAHEFLL